jgi:sulfite reductase (NADPH) flavoprotein alpha-component
MNNQKTFDCVCPLNQEKLGLLQQLEHNCSDIQNAWLSGYFWRSANKNTHFSVIEKPLVNIEQKITIISASQTGNAKLLSQRLNKYLNQNSIKNHLIYAIDYKFKNIKNEKILILIISTQGEGEVPEEAISFYNFIMSKRAPKLNNLYYSIFGLGDTSYNLFCQAAKDFDRRLQELGAQSLLCRFDADIEYEKDYLEWSQKILSIVKNKCVSFSSSSKNVKNKDHLINNPCAYNKNYPAIATVLTNQKITGRHSSKDIRHIEIDIKDLNMSYKPGDALGVWYRNDSNLIKKILTSLSINPLEQVNIKNDVINIFDALKNHFELTVNTTNIVKKYASFAKNHFLNDLILNKIRLNEYVTNTPLVNMFYDHQSKISSEQLINFLRPLHPRLYSISSSQSETNDEIHITVGVVKKNISGSFHFGGASGYLSQALKPDDKIKIFVEANDSFRLPHDQKTSIIMIASGTGIAPFRAFMQQRDHDQSLGKNWIFFGNPNFTEDFLYQIEWQKYIKSGLLNKITLAWSRDQTDKIYIQDKIREHGKEIWSWIKDGAAIYVCGNASKMAKDVELALLDIISNNNHMNIEDAKGFLSNLRMNKRYQRDVY